MIVSRDYLDRIQKIWEPGLMQSPELRMVSIWCMEYFQKYNKAPDSDIEMIYMEHLKAGHFSKAEGQYVEEMLASLSDEYGRDMQFNSGYLYDKTIRYFKASEIEQHSRQVQTLLDAGCVEDAEALVRSYRPKIQEDADTGLELSSEDVLDRIERAFSEASQPVLSYPGALGRMWNEHLVRGGFFSLLAAEKRGKSWFLLELALRAIRQKANVAFFEAGDMTESQILRRICIYIAQRSDKEKYCQERYRPIGDCVNNQLNMCGGSGRNCDFGIFSMNSDVFFKEHVKFINLETLIKKHEEFPDYEPCDSYNCKDRVGSVWLKKIKKSKPLAAKQAKKEIQKFFQKYRRRFKLIAYPAGILTVAGIRKCLDDWEGRDGFVPDILCIDYADLLSADDSKVTEFRHRQDHIWKALRALSQERHVLLLTATQADAESYKRSRLSMSNFSEDKRKLSYVTAQYGLNQDVSGREKKLSIMRINEIVVREGEFDSNNEVCVLQDLATGRPFLESY